MRSAALIVAIALGVGGCKKHEAEPVDKVAPIAVHCVAPKAEGIDETVALRGRIEPPPGGDLPVASQVAGRIVAIAVHEGQRIASGDLVATIDDAPSRDAVRQADALVAQARAADINATAALERTRALVERKIAARQELEDAIGRADAAHGAVAAATAALDLARRTLARVYVRSSFSGVVTRVWRGTGALVDGSSATPIVQLAASSKAEFVADATERELARIQEGQAVHGTLAVGGDAFEGTVRARSSSLDPVTGLATVRIALTVANDRIPIGAFGRVVVTTAHREVALVLPATALRGSVADGAEVIVCKDGKAEIKTVKVGWRDDERFEVLEGIDAEDRVAIDHVLGIDTDTPLLEAK